MSKTVNEVEEEKGPSRACNVCEECKLKEWKYKCPGCSLRSCSLPCVKAHKLRTLCTGKRNRTEFLPISQFDDNRLLSDYNFLEETRGVGESAKRLRNKLSLYAYFRLPFHLKSLRNAVSGRGTRLLFCPSGMSRREQNQTRYDQRKKCVYWTIEWQFHSTDVVLVDHGIDENMSIASAVGKHLEPGPWNHRLKKFCDEDLDSLKFFIRRNPKLAKSPLYQLDVKAPLRQQLANKFILEYPSIYVFLGSHTIDFEVIKQASSKVRKPQHEIIESNNRLSSQGVPFKEEEIEEEEDNISSDPRVFDLMKHGNSVSQIKLTQQSRSKNVCSDSSERALSSRVGAAVGGGFQASTEAIEQVLFNDVDFDFDQGLIDAYSSLIAEVNPDDFLDFEGLLAKQEVTEEEIKEFSCIEGELLAEEDDLEEGEIIE